MWTFRILKLIVFIGLIAGLNALTTIPNSSSPIARANGSPYSVTGSASSRVADCWQYNKSSNSFRTQGECKECQEAMDYSLKSLRHRDFSKNRIKVAQICAATTPGGALQTIEGDEAAYTYFPAQRDCRQMNGLFQLVDLSNLQPAPIITDTKTQNFSCISQNQAD